MSYYDSELADRAVNAFWQSFKRTGNPNWQQPCKYATETVCQSNKRRRVEICNGYGLLAIYEETQSGRVRRIQ